VVRVQATITAAGLGTFNIDAENGRQWLGVRGDQVDSLVLRERLDLVEHVHRPDVPFHWWETYRRLRLPVLAHDDVAAIGVVVGAIGGCVLLGLGAGWQAGLGLFFLLLVVWGGYVRYATARAAPDVEPPTVET
jgi:hypothetical protein